VLNTAKGAVAVRETFILRLFDRDGLVGAGEAGPAYWLGAETLAQTRASLRQLLARANARPSTAGELRRWAGLGEVFAAGRKVAHKGAARIGTSCAPPSAEAVLSPAALNALDCALLELCAKREGLSVAELLARDVAYAKPARPVAVSALLTAESTAALVAQARDCARAGFCTFKLKIGAGADDLKRVRAVARAVGPQATLRLDANRAYDFERAVSALSALIAAAPVEFVEEPLRRPSPAAYKRLRAITGARLALDESFADRASLEPYLDAGAADVIVLKAARLGGLGRCAALASLGARAGLAPCVTDSLESAVGMAAAVHLAAALPYPALAAGLGGARCIAPSALTPFPYASAALKAIGHGFAVRAA
jgi:o-succinylbenzoate synthase